MFDNHYVGKFQWRKVKYKKSWKRHQLNMKSTCYHCPLCRVCEDLWNPISAITWWKQLTDRPWQLRHHICMRLSMLTNTTTMWGEQDKPDKLLLALLPTHDLLWFHPLFSQLGIKTNDTEWNIKAEIETSGNDEAVKEWKGIHENGRDKPWGYRYMQCFMYLC